MNDCDSHNIFAAPRNVNIIHYNMVYNIIQNYIDGFPFDRRT